MQVYVPLRSRQRAVFSGPVARAQAFRVLYPRVLELEDLALGVHGDHLGEVSLGNGGGHLRDVADLVEIGRASCRERVYVLV